MAKTIKQKYTDTSIESISPRDFTRLRPGVYAGDVTYSTQLVREIFSNALDEHTSGRCNSISITIDKVRNIYTVTDDGQGFPINVKRPDGETVLQAAFDVMNTSGKYHNEDQASSYSGSIGTNGCGAKLTNFLSYWLQVYSTDGYYWERILFKDGIFAERHIGKHATSVPSGTSVSWEPDPQFFQNKQANIGELKKLFEDITALCPGLLITFNINDDKTTDTLKYHTQHGLEDLLVRKVGSKELLKQRFCVRKETATSMFDIALSYTSEYSENITAYVNYGLTESGIHISTLKAGMVRQINRYAEDAGLLKKNDSPLTSAEISQGLVVVFNLKANNVKYDSQTKVRVVDVDKTLINNIINNDFVAWLNSNTKDSKLIIEKALMARKAKEAAQNAKDRIRNASTKGKKFINLPTKLIDAHSKDRSECELYICEGDSAANGLIAKRDGKTQAVFPVRGKVLSCRKATSDKVYANQEISNIVKAIGLDIDKTTGKLIYDVKKLRYGKIILAADGDEDGAQIRALLINMFWWLCPELLLNRHIAVALPPLFRITTKNNEYIYLKDKLELQRYKKSHPKNDYLVNRNKGLGEQSPDELAFCLLRPATRTVKTLTVNDFNKADEMLEMAFGNSVDVRRQYLLQHLKDIIED